MARFVRWFSELGIEDVPLVGGKNASLGEMVRSLSARGVRVPDGFAITAEAYRHVLDRAGAWAALHEALDGLDAADVEDLARRGARAREIVHNAPFPDDLRAEILEAYAQLRQRYGREVGVAVRSSATAEDLPGASFAGQQETFLNVHGEQALIEACGRCFASLFTDRAIHYRIDKGFDHFKVALSIGVQKMVRSDLAASGVMFTVDTESGFPDVVFVTGAYGLGENVVQGAVDPDEFYVHKPTFEKGFRAVLGRRLGAKKIKMVLRQGRVGATTRNVPTSPEERERFCIPDEDVLQLAAYALEIERHYSERAGHWQPMDIEWAKDREDGLLYIVQARPETVVSQRDATVLETWHKRGDGEVLCTGRAVGTSVAQGRARIIGGLSELSRLQDGEVLVADTTTPDWEPVMERAAA
ncbi:MAG: phosphoenolpyruvate synthase, partial [Planctomycetota bacterium]